MSAPSISIRATRRGRWAAENVIQRAVVSTDKLNVRKEPSQDSEIMGQVYKDERYPVESIQDGWVQIDDGYLSADYVTVRYASMRPGSRICGPRS